MKQTKEQIIARYEAAFLAANKKPIKVEFIRGRFQLGDSHVDNRLTTTEIVNASWTLEQRAANKMIYLS